MNPQAAHATVSISMTRTHEDIQNELLVLQCQSGDEEALHTLVTVWQPLLDRLAMRFTNDREAAKDIVQNAWIAIVRGLRRLDDPARFRPWAYRIVTNKCADWMRHRIKQRAFENEFIHRTGGQAASGTRVTDNNESSFASDSQDDVIRLRAALKKLPEQQRVMLSLYYLDGMRVSQIADVLNVPAGTVKSRLFHARCQLKKILERVEI